MSDHQRIMAMLGMALLMAACGSSPPGRIPVTNSAAHPGFEPVAAERAAAEPGPAPVVSAAPPPAPAPAPVRPASPTDAPPAPPVGPDALPAPPKPGAITCPRGTKRVELGYSIGFEAGPPVEAQCQRPNGILHGPTISMTAPVGFHGAYWNNEKHGIWRYWSISGSRITELRIESYHRGQPHGTWKHLRSDGLAWSEQRYEHGVQHGPLVERYPDGRLRSVGSYYRGAPDGVWTSWSPEGKRRRVERWYGFEGRIEEWQDDRLTAMYFSENSDAIAAVYTEDELAPLYESNAIPPVFGPPECLWGPMQKPVPMALPANLPACAPGTEPQVYVIGARYLRVCETPDKRFEGPFTEHCAADGRLRMTGHYRAGHEHGPWATWHANGQKDAQGTYDLGYRQGTWMFWDEQGKLIRTEVYERGVLRLLDGRKARFHRSLYRTR